jgi:hypothetical protein
MSRLYFILILCLLGPLGVLGQSMVTKTITPIRPALPVVYQDNIKGGFHSLSDLFTDDIPAELKQEGMIAFDQLTQCNYQWNGTNWLAVYVIRTWVVGDAKTNQMYVRNGKIYQALQNTTITAGTNPDDIAEAANWQSLGDGFGNHTATANIQMGDNAISKDGAADKGLVFDGDGNATFNQDVTIKGNFAIPSDGRLKTNIRVPKGVLGKVSHLHGVSFSYANQNEYATGTHYGLIAQELQKQFPEMVTQGADGFYRVDYLQMTAILLQAIKEQQTLIEQLMNENNQ